MKDKFKAIIGDILINLRPKRAAGLAESGMTIMRGQQYSKLDHWMRDAMIRKAEKNGDHEKLASYQRAYWVNHGQEFFDQTNDSFENAFLPQCSFLFDLLEAELAQHPEKYITIVEIGTGNGKVLKFLGDKFKQVKRLVGIDLSRNQIEINKKNYELNKRLEFVADDAFDWVNTHGQSHMIFVTSRGVLEYFTEKRLLQFFKKLNSLGKIIFVAIEPNGVDHDFSMNPNSQPYGTERSFSHNYEALFETAGFNIWHTSKKELGRDDYYFSFLGAKN